jgi:hypothetical protein
LFFDGAQAHNAHICLRCFMEIARHTISSDALFGRCNRTAPSRFGDRL